MAEPRYMDVIVDDGVNAIKTVRKVDHYEAPVGFRRCSERFNLHEEGMMMVPMPELREGEILFWEIGSLVPRIIVVSV